MKMGHSKNVQEDDNKKNMVEEVRHTRKVYKKELSGQECKAWVADPNGILAGTEPRSSTEAVSELKRGSLPATMCT